MGHVYWDAFTLANHPSCSSTLSSPASSSGRHPCSCGRTSLLLEHLHSWTRWRVLTSSQWSWSRLVRDHNQGCLGTVVQSGGHPYSASLEPLPRGMVLQLTEYGFTHYPQTCHPIDVARCQSLRGYIASNIDVDPSNLPVTALLKRLIVPSDERRCPHCLSTNVRRTKMPSWNVVKRLMGASAVRCRSCRRRFLL